VANQQSLKITTNKKTIEPDANKTTEAYGTPRDDQGLKIFPKVAIERVECRPEEGRLLCEAVIKNESEYRMELTRLILAGTDKSLANAGIDNFLDPEEEREFIIYDGQPLTTDALHDCELHYKNDSGDYFNAQHFVNYALQPDGTFMFDTINFVPPVRDIYE
jgi:hypothetical protein